VTVTDRRGATAASGRLAWTATPAEPLDPIDLFSAARALGAEAALWLQPDAHRSIVGIGRAWAFEGGGPDRFTAGAAAWRALLADAIGSEVEVPETGPTLLGGLGFSGRLPAEGDAWEPFGPASLVLPTFGFAQSGGRAGLTVAIGPDQAAGVEPDDVERRWAQLTRPIDATPADAGRLRSIDERPDHAQWDRMVGLFAGAVGRGRIDKVVLARRVVYEAAADLDVTAALRHLARTAPESTTFAFTRNGSTFFGATPERLVRTVGRAFETTAIAGSAPRGRDAEDDARLVAALLASEKEREEHAVVVDTLRAGLTPIVDDLEIAETPAILPLRHLQHLVTPITGTTHDEAGLLALAERIHPTPAVGGAPRDLALAMIDEHEGFDRGWYAGPVGRLSADGDGELMVALRCGIVTGSRATMFAGCGIVADSEPEREWAESGLKLRTMLAALGGTAEDDR
jgi:isochorismate synthase